MTIEKTIRKRISSDFNLSNRKFYQVFKKETGLKHITYQQYSDVLANLFAQMAEVILKDVYSVKIPRFGTFFMDRYKGRTIDVDVLRTQHKVVKKVNLHTDGYIYRIKFYGCWGDYEFMRNYKFKTVKTLRTKMANKFLKKDEL